MVEWGVSIFQQDLENLLFRIQWNSVMNHHAAWQPLSCLFLQKNDLLHFWTQFVQFGTKIWKVCIYLLLMKIRRNHLTWWSKCVSQLHSEFPCSVQKQSFNFFLWWKQNITKLSWSDSSIQTRQDTNEFDFDLLSTTSRKSWRSRKSCNVVENRDRVFWMWELRKTFRFFPIQEAQAQMLKLFPLSGRLFLSFG